MGSRVIHLIDAEAGNYQWPFKLGDVIWSKTHRVAATVVDGWFELRSPGNQDRKVLETGDTLGVQMFYRIDTVDGREFSVPAQDLVAR